MYLESVMAMNDFWYKSLMLDLIVAQRSLCPRRRQRLRPSAHPQTFHCQSLNDIYIWQRNDDIGPVVVFGESTNPGALGSRMF
jgi:hypothetical protein